MPKRKSPSNTNTNTFLTLTNTNTNTNNTLTLTTQTTKQQKHRNYKKYQWQQKQFTNLPKYLDAQSTLTASKFSARRLPEIQSLWSAFVHGQNKNDMGGGAGGDDVEYYKSGGCKISNRHRRRRTGSHKRRRFHRFPQGDGDGDAEDEYDGHDGDGDGDEGERAMSGSLSRRGRRKHTILRATNTQWQWNMNTNTPNTTTQSMASNAIDSNKKWMMTHLYHSKRFHMMTPTPTPHTSSTSSNTTSNSSISIFNGWCVPLCHTNRGSQAALRLATNDGKCTIQDSTWNIGGSILTLTANTASSTSKGSRSKVVNLVSRLLSYNAAAVLTPRVLDGMEVGYGLVYDDHITDSDITFPDGALGPASFLFGTSSSCSTRTTRENDDGDNNEENTHTCYYVKILMEGSILKKATKMIHELWHEMDTTDGETDADGEDLDSEEESKSDENANENAHANKSSSSSSSSSSNSSSIHTNAMTLLRLRGADATEIISRNLLFHRYRSHNVGHGHGHGHGHDYDYDYEERLHDHLPHGTVIKLTFDSVVNVNDDDVQKDDYLKQFRRDLASSKGSGNGNGNGSSNGSTGSTGKKVEDCESSNGNGGSVSLKAILNVNVNGDGDAHGHGHGNATDTSTAGKDNEIILISQNPNRSTSTSTSTSHSNANANANANTTVNGWDILLPPSLAHTIFIALVHDNAHNHKHGGVSGAGAGGGEGGGGACPIGLVEEACMRTEADPPLPVYPRDYMDTALGLEYWNGDGDGDGDDEREAEVRKRRKEWKVVRYCMEEGTTNGGRIKTGLKRLLQECHVTDRHMDMDRNGNGNEKYEKLNDKDKDKDKAKDTGMISKGMKSEYGNASNGDGGTALPNSNSSCTGNDRNSNTNIHEKEEVDIDTDTSSSSSKEVRDRDRDRDSDREGQVESPYDFQPSGGSIISKKSRGMGRFKKWQQIDDGEMPNENLNAHLNFGTTSSRRNVPENVETNIPRLGDELFDFGENTNGNTNAKQQNEHSSANAHLNSPMHSVKLDPYEDSCDVSVLGSMMGGGDDGSFFSARTSGTYGTYNTYGSINTTGTNASVSTRRRHRGAAKKKLGESLNGHGNGTANGKSQPSGWLESIKAAAETTNRKWDPKVGWIDYTPTANGNMKDMERDTRPDKSRIGRLKAPSFKKMSHGNGKSSRSSLDDDNDDDDKSVKSNVPFPHDWEAARDNMVRSYKTPIDRDKDKAQDKAQDKDDYSVAEASAKTEVRSNTKLPPPTENPPPMEIETTLTGIGITSNDYKHDYIVLGANETIQEESEEEPDSPSPRVQVFDNKEVTNNKGISSLMDEESNEDDISDDVDLNPIRKDEATASVSSGKQEVIAPPRNSLMNWVDCGTSQVSLSVKSRASGASNNMYPAVPKSPIPSSPKSTASKSQVTSRSHNQTQPRSTEDSGYAQFPAYEGKGSAGHMDVDSHPGASEVDRSRNISGDDNDNDDIDGSYDEDEFGQNHDSFDFSNTDSKELDASDDGFKVVKSIDSATARSITSKDSNSPLEAKIGKAKAKGHSKTHAYSPSSRDSRKRSSQVPRSPSSPEDDKTTFSVATANSMSSKAKDWLKRVEMQKQKSALSNNNSRSKPQAEEPSASALFVSAADDASTFEYGNNRSEQEGENDTVFDFEEPRSSKSKNYTRKQGETAAPPFKQQERQRQRQQGRQRENQEKRGRNLNNDSMSEITAPSEVSSFASKRRPQVQSFLSRLQSCTSPTFEDQDGNGNGNSNSNMPSAHLAFLKKSAQDTVNCAPTGAAAGGQGIIDLLQAQTFCGTTGAGAGGASTTSGLPPLAPSAAGSGTNKGKGSIASSYLQAIKERSTGTGSISGKTSSGAERSPSVASTTSSKSETWQKFLEKRNQALESTSRRSLTPSQSKAAEKYAAQKLEEIMKEASAVPDNGNDDDDDSKRSKSTTKLRPPSSTAGMLPRSKSTGRPQMDRRLSRKYALSRNEAAKAAQDLAAARVEAMMAMTSSTRLEEGEI
mmetsp:Transcript_15005/g.21781  ORF Transcript_15005/g.21781 Transcript_15005/m.21781 type:complete len:1992 (+) Transcript_15005:194-6169(+)